MTCRLELETAGESYPRSCPECGFGPCKRGYEQVKHPMGGYDIKRPDGTVYKPPQFGAVDPSGGNAAVTATVRPKLTRVQRARLMDWLEANLKTAIPYTDKGISDKVDEILAIIDTPTC